MDEAARKEATYADLYSLPEDNVGEIIDGELIAVPRPSRKHGFSAYALGGELVHPYQFGRGGGPGGWVLIGEPEVRFGDNYLVPDIAGWRKERFPIEEETNWISIPPHWATEILSPNTVRIDRVKKMSIYARYGVSFLWLLDPLAKTLEAFRLVHGAWLLMSVFGEKHKVRAEPFEAIEIDLSDLWR